METLESEIWRKRFETDGNCFFLTRARSQPGWMVIDEMSGDYGCGYFLSFRERGRFPALRGYRAVLAPLRGSFGSGIRPGGPAETQRPCCDSTCRRRPVAVSWPNACTSALRIAR